MSLFRLKRVALEAVALGLALFVVGGLYTAGLLAGQQPAYGQAQAYKVSWSLPGQPREARVGLRLGLNNLELTNSGSQVWPRSGPDRLRLAYRWFGPDNRPLDPKSQDNGYDDLRAELPVDIPVAGRVVFPQVLIGTPNLPGEYLLRLDLVKGENEWLADKGGQDLSLKLQVRPRDTAAPQAKVSSLPLFSTSTVFNVSWSGQDESGGSGLATFDVQYREAGEKEWRDWLVNTAVSGAQFTGENGRLYLFRARATDLAGNQGRYPDDEQAGTRVDSLPPVARVEALPAFSAEHFLVRWSSHDNVAGRAILCDVQYRQGETGPWLDWLFGNSAGSAIFQGQAGQTYYFRARATDYAGNQGDFPPEAQARTRALAAYNSFSMLSTRPQPQPSLPTLGPDPVYSAYFPLAVKDGENRAGTTTLTIYNPWTDPLDVFINFNDRAGAPFSAAPPAASGVVTGTAAPPRPLTGDEATALARVDTLLRTVQPGQTLNIWAGSLAPAAFNGWAEVRAARDFVASAIRTAPASGPVAYAPARSATQLYLPFVRRLGPLNSSYINLANPTTTPAEVTVTYYDLSGAPVASEKRVMPRLSSARWSLNSIPNLPPELRLNGTAVISSNTPLAAAVENLLEDGTPQTYPAVSSPAGGAALSPSNQAAFSLPVYRDVENLTTTLLIQNAVKEPAQVRLEYLDERGNILVAREIRLAGYSRVALWTGEVKELPQGFAGRVRLTSTTANATLAAIAPGASARHNQYP